MILRPPISTRTDTLFPYTTLFRSRVATAAAENKIIAVIAGEHVVASTTDEAVAPFTADGVQGMARRQRRAVHDHPFVGSDIVATAEHAVTAETDHGIGRSEEHTSELQSLMRISYAVFCLKKKKQI